MKGHKPTDVFYTAVMIDGDDGTILEHHIDFSAEDMSKEEAYKQAVNNARWYNGITVVYECRPIEIFPGDEFINAALKAVNKKRKK